MNELRERKHFAKPSVERRNEIILERMFAVYAIISRNDHFLFFTGLIMSSGNLRGSDQVSPS